MIGPRCGAVCRAVVGVRVGVGVDELGGDALAGVTKDATSGIYCPASAAEWTQVLSAAGIGSGGPSFLWLLQETSGSPADQIGGATLTVAGSPTYSSPVTGWSRKAIQFTDGATSSLSSTASPMVGAGSTSALIIAYVKFNAAETGGRNILGWGGSTHDVLQYISGSRVQLGTSVSSAGSYNYNDAAVHPMVFRNDVTHSTVSFYSDKEKVPGTYQACAGTGLWLAGDTLAGPVSLPYAACFTGAAAQLSDAQIKTLLQTLAWAPSWT